MTGDRLRAALHSEVDRLCDRLTDLDTRTLVRSHRRSHHGPAYEGELDEIKLSKADLQRLHANIPQEVLDRNARMMGKRKSRYRGVQQS